MDTNVVLAAEPFKFSVGDTVVVPVINRKVIIKERARTLKGTLDNDCCNVAEVDGTITVTNVYYTSDLNGNDGGMYMENQLDYEYKTRRNYALRWRFAEGDEVLRVEDDEAVLITALAISAVDIDTVLPAYYGKLKSEIEAAEEEDDGDPAPEPAEYAFLQSDLYLSADAAAATCDYGEYCACKEDSTGGNQLIQVNKNPSNEPSAGGEQTGTLDLLE